MAGRGSWQPAHEDLQGAPCREEPTPGEERGPGARQEAGRAPALQEEDTDQPAQKAPGWTLTDPDSSRLHAKSHGLQSPGRTSSIRNTKKCSNGVEKPASPRTGQQTGVCPVVTADPPPFRRANRGSLCLSPPVGVSRDRPPGPCSPSRPPRFEGAPGLTDRPWVFVSPSDSGPLKPSQCLDGKVETDSLS